MGPKRFADAVDEKLYPAATRAHIDVEVLAFHEQLADLTQGAPVRTFVKALAPDVLEHPVAPGTGDRIGGDRLGTDVGAGTFQDGVKRRILHPLGTRPTLPAGVQTVVHRLAAFAAGPHMPEAYEPDW